MMTAISVYEGCAAVSDPDERENVARLVCAFAEVRDMAKGRIEEMKRRAASLGMPYKTFERLYYKWRNAEKRREGG